MPDKHFDADVEKAVKDSERMRGGSPNNVLWLIVQQIRYVAGLIIGIHVKLDKLLRGVGTCDLTEVTATLVRIEATEQIILDRLDELEAPPSTGSQAGARIVVRGPVSNR